MHMEVPPPLSPRFAFTRREAPFKKATLLAGRLIQRWFPKIPMKLLCLWLEGESQCASPPRPSPPPLHPSIHEILPLSPPKRESPAHHQPFKLAPNHSYGHSNLISMKFAADSLYCAPPAKCVWFNRSELNPRVGRWRGGRHKRTFLTPKRCRGSWRSNQEVSRDL